MLIVNNNITIIQIFYNRLYSLGVHSGKGYGECIDIFVDDIELSSFLTYTKSHLTYTKPHLICWLPNACQNIPDTTI